MVGHVAHILSLASSRDKSRDCSVGSVLRSTILPDTWPGPFSATQCLLPNYKLLDLAYYSYNTIYKKYIYWLTAKGIGLHNMKAKGDEKSRDCKDDNKFPSIVNTQVTRSQT